ncbi:tautomerase family protein [Marinococcus luteus]|uniref:tautomerase family protein n=1 Tax=Marinococcus luteus TaxID=1122204 RepID=UPI002ACC8A3B|nr:tautomerase family protein [Marinococcus luteus]MDZ5783971.1 tautomerase family protein [Marinococcus luteus]
MPLIRMDVIEGRTEEELKLVADAIHDAVVESFEVPERDRYQIINQHKPYEMYIEDTGLGFERTNNIVVIQVISKTRTAEQKKMLYKKIANNLQDRCSIGPEDVMVSITDNTEADWSFGLGEAQFLNGKL